MPVPRSTRRSRLPVAVATAAVLLLLTALAGPAAAFWTLAGLAVVVTSVAALGPTGRARPEAPTSPTPDEVPADDADLVTLLTL